MIVKYFTNMSEEQIAALTQADLDKRINLACAEDGIPIFVPVPVKPVAPEKPLVPVYEVNDMFFLDPADAQAVVDVMNACTSRVKNHVEHYSTIRDCYTTEGLADAQIEMKKMYPVDYRQSQSTALKQYEEALSAHEKAETKYRSMTSQRNAIGDQVLAEYNEACASIQAAKRAVELYQRYVELADGDRAIAWRFLVRAEKLTPDDIQHMKLHEACELDKFNVPLAEAEPYQS